MRLVLFCHSLVSDWNHGNAHFLRGIVSELGARGHRVDVYEPVDGWSLSHLLAEHGESAVGAFRAAYPELDSRCYSRSSLDLDAVLDGADVVLVHEWNDPKLIARVGRVAATTGCIALFHDTHHRSVTRPADMATLDLSRYAGVLAFGAAVAEQYRRNDWCERAWVWHEAADTRRFRPLGSGTAPSRDLVWIGNWGDGERTAELTEFLLDPIASLDLRATFHGVRYPDDALARLSQAGIDYRGWLPNHRVPAVFAEHACTVHVPRRAYAQTLAGVPTIRVFEALACGIPLVSAPWHDSEALFRPGQDYLVAANGAEMRSALHDVLNDRELAASLRQSGLESVLARHTCAHRVNELFAIIEDVRGAHHEAAVSAAGC